jgi:FtsP/CotA-like multicopper oxidase with cupredoxin domain
MLERKLAVAAIAATAAACAAEAATGMQSGAAVPGPLNYKFEVAMVRGTIWNPWTLRHDAVELRSWRGAGIKDGDFVAPPVRVKPGQTLRIHLDNHLPPCTIDETKTGSCHNDTNLHTHGLWVSPAGNSDNVMISIAPGEQFDYEFLIPDDHPAGTFWYHPHRHGSGAYQVGSGMAGALIVEGDRPPTLDRPGDIDVLLKDAKGRPFPERVVVLQTIPYACSFDQDGWPHFARDASGKRVGPVICNSGEVGRIERASQFIRPPEGVRTGRYSSINGRVQPLLSGPVAGRFERWRMVDAGTFGVRRLAFRRLAAGAPDLSAVGAAEQPQWIARHCVGPILPLWQVARDGLTSSQIRRTEEATLTPGGRLDLLTWFPEPGRYCLLQNVTPLDRPSEKAFSVLSVVEVTGRSAREINPERELQHEFVMAAGRALPGTRNAAMRSKVITDLEHGMRLSSFVAHPTITDAELTGHQKLEFRTVGDELTKEFLADGRKFDHERIDRHLPLGGVEEWQVTVPPKGGIHVFHIHVNPFQIVSIRNAKGEDVTAPGSPGFDPIYADLSGQWLDTAFLQGGITLVMRTRYERFVGDTMLHCHVVIHSDLGMMQSLRIGLPENVEGQHVHH